MVILKKLEDIAKIAEEEVNYDNLHTILYRLAEVGRIRVKLASMIQFKGTGCFNFPPVSRMPDKILALDGKNVYNAACV